MATDAEIIELVLEQVELRWRLSKADNMLDNAPTPDELTAFIWDTIDEINSHPPQTSFSLSDIYEGADTRWKRLLYMGTAKNHLYMIVHHWTAEGFDAQIDDLQAQSKESNFKDLLGTLTTDFETLLERLKLASQKFVRGTSSTNKDSIIEKYTGTWSTSRVLRY